MSIKICFATNNSNKLSEVRDLVPQGIEIISLDQIGYTGEIPENKNTIEGNSKQKAEHIANLFKTDCFADDTGLEVTSLKGKPGVLSARYAGTPVSSKKNIEKLLKELENKEDRSARFKTVVTLIIDGNIHQFEGIINGMITYSPKGVKGFGYDPVFIPDGHQKTFAELSNIEKNKISHRAIATKKLVKYLYSL